MPRRSTRALVILARYPTPGQVKTRLAAAIGGTAACQLYRCFLLDLDARFAARDGFDLVWAYTPPESDFGALFNGPRACLAQRGRGMAESMWHVFQDLFAHGYERVAMIGSDVPHVADDAVEQALADVGAAADVVLGPSVDGGYYLVALSRPHDIFRAVPMGTNKVLEATLARIDELGLVSEQLAPSFDVDEVSDLARLRSVLEAPSWNRALRLTKACLKAFA